MNFTNFRGFLKKEYLILYCIILIGSILRLQSTFANSFAFTYDVGRDLLAVGNILYAHKFSLIGPTSGLEGVFYGPWWYLIILPFFIASFGNPQGINGLMAILGIAAIFFAYFFGKRVGGSILGITFASILTVSSPLVGLSVQIWSPNISPLFVVLALFALYKIYEEKIPRLRYFFSLGFLLALIPDLGIVFGFVFLIGIFLSLAINAYKKISLKSAIAFVLGVLVIFSPRILFELRHDFLMTKAFVHFLTVGDSSQNIGLVVRFADRMNTLFNVFNSTFGLSNQIWQIVIILFISITIILCYKNADVLIKKFINTSLTILLVFLVALTFFRHDVWSHYLVGLPIIYILLFSIAITLVVRRTKNYIIPAILVFVIFLINLNPTLLINGLIKPAISDDPAVYKNQLQVIDYVYKESKGKDFKYVVYTPPVHDYTYQYLFKWYGPNKYHYSSSIKSRLAYFILEPDREKPSRLTNWLKLRVGDGKIIKTEKLWGGIIVQTRIH